MVDSGIFTSASQAFAGWRSDRRATQSNWCGSVRQTTGWTSYHLRPGRQHIAIEQLDRPRAADISTVTAPSRQESAPTALAESATIARIGLQAALGYEWLVSGLDKVLYGRFPEAL